MDWSATINRILIFSGNGVLRQTLTPNTTINSAQTYTLNYTDDSTLFIYLEYNSPEPLLSLTGILEPASPYSKLLFVSSDGTGDGGSPDTPLASDTLSDNLATATTNTAVYLMDDCAVASDVFLYTHRYLLTSITREQRTIAFEASSLFGTTGAAITLTNIILDGYELHNESLLTLSGLSGAVEFTLADRAVLRNRYNTNTSTGGGAILIGDSCTVTMEAGSEITDCTSDTVSGGAVCIALASINGTADFIMNGGEISACSAAYGGAVSIDDSPDGTTPTVTIQGGTISDCEAFAAGGAVSVRASYQAVLPVVSMSNGRIQNCTAPIGGAISYQTNELPTGILNITGGIIEYCQATGSVATGNRGLGGAVYLDGGYSGTISFTMSGGEIRECDAYGQSTTGNGLGGAVYLSTEMGWVKLSMSGGTIRDCTAHDSSDNAYFGQGGHYSSI